MTRSGKFLLLSLGEFEKWLTETAFTRKISLLQNHHTAEPSYRSFSRTNHFRLLGSMEHYHIVERGFSEIAQNLTSFPDGTIAVCRPLDTIPAGIKGANQKGICIEHLGNFDSGNDTMTREQEVTIIGMNALLCTRFALVPGPDTIVYHHWYDLITGRRTDGAGTTKTCPGSAFFGGNSVAAAVAGFYPLVSQGMVATAPATAAASVIRSATVNVTLLNIRDGASTNSRIIGKLRQGVPVDIFEEQDGWCRIDSISPRWVYGAYVE